MANDANELLDNIGGKPQTFLPYGYEMIEFEIVEVKTEKKDTYAQLIFVIKDVRTEITYEVRDFLNSNDVGEYYSPIRKSYMNMKAEPPKYVPSSTTYDISEKILEYNGDLDWKKLSVWSPKKWVGQKFNFVAKVGEKNGNNWLILYTDRQARMDYLRTYYNVFTGDYTNDRNELEKFDFREYPDNKKSYHDIKEMFEMGAIEPMLAKYGVEEVNGKKLNVTAPVEKADDGGDLSTTFDESALADVTTEEPVKAEEPRKTNEPVDPSKEEDDYDNFLKENA